MKAGKADLKGTKYDWLSNRKDPQTETALQGAACIPRWKTARAWAIKELAMSLWGLSARLPGHPRVGRGGYPGRYAVDPADEEEAKTIKKHLWGILNAIF